MLSKAIKKILTKAIKASHDPLIRNMLIVGVVTLLVKCSAFYKETIIAGSFGLNVVIDTFIIASLVPTFVNSVFISSVTNLFIPNYITELKNKGDKSGFQSVVFIIVISISLVSILLSYLSFDLFLDIVYPNQPLEYYQMAKDQFYIILPCLFFWGVGSIITGLLEVDSKFFITSIADIFPIIVMVLFLFFLKDHLGPMVLAYGTLAGTLVGFTFLLLLSIKKRVLAISKAVLNINSKLMIRQLPPKISSGFLSSMNNFVNQFFAGQLAVGSLAALSYANRIPSFAVSIIVMSSANVLLPHFSRLVNEDIKKAYQYLFKVLKLVFISLAVVVTIGIFMSDWVIEIWLERGKFTHGDTLKVSDIQKILLLNVPFYLCTLIIVKFLTSINKNSFMAWTSLINLIVNITLNAILIKHYGVYGLAMSTTMVLTISSCFYFVYTYNLYKKIEK